MLTVFSYVGITELTIKSLSDYISNTEISVHWKGLGTKLLNDTYVQHLTIIETNNRHDVRVCCREMFIYWLQVDREANWNQLINALEEMQLNTLAKEIREDVLEGMVNS